MSYLLLGLESIMYDPIMLVILVGVCRGSSWNVAINMSLTIFSEQDFLKKKNYTRASWSKVAKGNNSIAISKGKITWVRDR